MGRRKETQPVKTCFAAALMFIATTLPAFAADVTGKWTGQMKSPNGEFALEFNFKQDGSTLTGSVQGPQGDPSPISDGKVEGDKLSFTVKVGDGPIVIHHEGTVSGDTIKLSSKVEDGDFEPGEITLTKAKQ
jgi:hypothetical protein